MDQRSPLAVTISRQLGSGAAFVGQQRAKKLDAFYADRHIIRMAAEKLSVTEEDLQSRDETVPSFWWSLVPASGFVLDVYVPPKLVFPTERELFEAESEVIARMAKERSAVFIGRCGFQVLREHPNHASIFLHVGRTFRRERVQELYRLSKDDAEKMVTKSDKERATFCKTFTGKDWADARNFDLAIDTSKLQDLDKVTDAIYQYLQLR
jgi:CMP/dCMP kinase